MTPRIAEVAARRIAEHATAHRLATVHVILHGGEPLLAGPVALRAILDELRAAITPVARLDLRMQSNGVRLSESMCELLAGYGVQVGISLDGGLLANDRHRRFANGASSHEAVLRGLRGLRRPAYRHLYAGILCTVDIRNDPIDVYEALLAEEPPRIDFLLPHATWDSPPPRPPDQSTAYGDWLLRVHGRWIADGRPVAIRIFDGIRSTGVGGSSGSEALGLDPVDLAVIETDGTWEQADSLKTAFDGAPATGLDVFSHSVDDLAALPSVAGRLEGLASLCATCQSCPVVGQCGGGLFAHRFGRAGGFDHPSVYCRDLRRLIVGVNSRSAVVPAARTGPDDGVTASDGVEAGRPIPSPRLIDEIGSGYGDASTVGYLADAEYAITRALLVAVADGIGDSGPAAAAWEVLVRLDVTAPDAVRSVIAHPYVRAWAVDCLAGPTGRPGGHPADSDESHGAGRSYLCSLAAVAALRAGVSVELELFVRRGQVHLPTHGTVVLPTSATGRGQFSLSSDGFSVRLDDAGVTVQDGGRGQADWRPTYRIHDDILPVLLEDQDPHRDRHDWPAEGRLSAAAAQDWGRRVRAARQVIERYAPRYLPGLRGGLRVISPLAADRGGRLRSSTPRHAFGAVGIAPAPPQSLATMVVHEFQHAKLGALLDLCDLFDRDYAPRLAVGWRPDARPVEGALQGTYAHLAVADIWRARLIDGRYPEAAAQVHRYRDWTLAAIDALDASGALTEEGIVFVGRMADTVAGFDR